MFIAFPLQQLLQVSAPILRYMYIASLYIPVYNTPDYHLLHGYCFAVLCLGNTPKPKKHLDINCVLCDEGSEAEESLEYR
jgi:hypothetical protein